MNKERYKLELEQALKEYNAKKNNIMTDYAISNNPHKIGSIITDHYHTIKIEKIQAVFSGISLMPECVYVGIELKKDGTYKKKQEYNPVYQSNINK